MGLAIQLKRMGIDDLVILEREADLGGTWHVNRYPGLAVDIPSATYSFSFAPNPYWSRVFCRGPELKQYCDHVADTFDLRRHMRFGESVTGARWDEDASLWRISTAEGGVLTARYLFACTGYLSEPQLPDIAGLEEFAGPMVHTAQWDDSVDMAGKRIAVIGTGATAVQLIPRLAKVAAELTVYQRTPIWVFPKYDRRIPGFLQRLYARIPATQKVARFIGWAGIESLLVFGVLHYRYFGFFNRIAAALTIAQLRRQVPDPELRRKLTPDYDYGCKRPTVANDYYSTFTKPSVHLETTTIDHVDEHGVVTTDGRRTDIDVLVLATGFSLWESKFPAFEIIGRDGRDLGKWWRANGFQAYAGMTVPGFPNFVPQACPYAFSGLSFFNTIEYQMTHLERLFAAMRERGADTFEVRTEANDRFLAAARRNLDSSVFTRGNCSSAHSYYWDPNGEPSLLRPTSTITTRRGASRFPLEDYTYAAS